MPSNELSAEMFSRVRMMAGGDPQWDLSDNDTAALRHVLAAAEAREAAQPTAAEVIEALNRCFDTIKHLSADIGTERGDSAVNGVALLGLSKIARWKEANGGK